MKRKLITLHSNSNDGLFDCNFNDDIIIDKDSNVSFISCSLTLDNNKIVIDNDNDDVTFQIGGAPLRTALIPHGIYSNDNIGDLIMRIQNAINKELDIDQPDEHGNECRIHLTDQNKIEIVIQGTGYDHAVDDSSGAFDTDFFHKVGINLTGGTTKLSRTTGTSSSTGFFDAFITANNSNSRGCGASLVTIVTLSNGNPAVNGGFMMGWLEGNHKKHLDADDFTYYVHAPNSNLHPYIVKQENNVIVTTTLYPRVGDTVGLVLSEGMISLAIYNPADAGSGTYLQLGAFPYDEFSEQTTPPFFTVLTMFGSSTTTVVKDYVVNLNAHVNQQALTNKDLVEAGGISSQPPASNGNDQHRYKLNFPTLALAKDLGYNIRNFDSIFEVRTFRETAVNIFANVFHPDNYKIELLNINLESYDSQTQGRRNILGIIPISESFLDQNISLLQYEVNNIIALSVRNKNTEALRNIRARLINSHNETAITYGLSFINIMVEYDL